MKITLLSPKNNDVISMKPEHQDSILAALPKGDQVIDDDFNIGDPTHNDVDHSKPREVFFTWNIDGESDTIVDFSLHLAQNPNFENSEIFTIYPGEVFLGLNNLAFGKEYFWKLVITNLDKTVCESEVYRFYVENTLPHWYSVEGISNFRDIGGYHTKDGKTVAYGKIYRGSAIFKPDDETLLFLQNDLKIKTELDLRFDTDVTGITTSPISGADWINIPVLTYADITQPQEKEKYKKLFEVLTDASRFPVYIHCIAGADRTGGVVAILLALLGVPDDVIEGEYEMTSLSVFGIRSRRHKSFLTFKELLSSYGDTWQEQSENYLLSCGLKKSELQQIKDNLLI